MDPEVADINITQEFLAKITKNLKNLEISASVLETKITDAVAFYEKKNICGAGLCQFMKDLHTLILENVCSFIKQDGFPVINKAISISTVLRKYNPVSHEVLLPIVRSILDEYRSCDYMIEAKLAIDDCSYDNYVITIMSWNRSLPPAYYDFNTETLV